MLCIYVKDYFFQLIHQKFCFVFFGINIGSNPQPFPFSDFDIVPDNFPSKDLKIIYHNK